MSTQQLVNATGTEVSLNNMGGFFQQLQAAGIQLQDASMIQGNSNFLRQLSTSLNGQWVLHFKSAEQNGLPTLLSPPSDTATVNAGLAMAGKAPEAIGARAHVIILAARRSDMSVRSAKTLYPNAYAGESSVNTAPICASIDGKGPVEGATFATTYGITKCQECPVRNRAAQTVSRLNPVPCRNSVELIAVTYTPGVLPDWKDAFIIRGTWATSWNGSTEIPQGFLNGYTAAEKLLRNPSNPAELAPAYSVVCELGGVESKQGGSKTVGFRFVSALDIDMITHIAKNIAPKAFEYMDSPMWAPSFEVKAAGDTFTPPPAQPKPQSFGATPQAQGFGTPTPQTQSFGTPQTQSFTAPQAPVFGDAPAQSQAVDTAPVEDLAAELANM